MDVDTCHVEFNGNQKEAATPMKYKPHNHPDKKGTYTAEQSLAGFILFITVILTVFTAVSGAHPAVPLTTLGIALLTAHYAPDGNQREPR